MRKLVGAVSVLALWLSFPAVTRAGLLDIFHGSSGQPDVTASVAEARIRTYLEEVLGLQGVTLKNGHGALSAGELKILDQHVTSRMVKAPAMVVAKMVASGGVTGIAAIAAPGVAASDWDPSKGFLAYVQLDSNLVFPAEADRALLLAAHLAGEHAMFGFAPEAGPLWKVTERYLNAGAMGGMGGGESAHFASDDGATPSGYSVEAGETSPEAEDIPAWIVRGLTDLTWKKEKPVEMGLLIALTRRPGSSSVRLTHVAGIGPLGKALFKDAARLKKEADE